MYENYEYKPQVKCYIITIKILANVHKSAHIPTRRIQKKFIEAKHIWCSKQRYVHSHDPQPTTHSYIM